MIAVCCFLFTVYSTHVNYMPNVLTTFFLLIYSYLSIPRVLEVLPWRIRFRVFWFERLRWETMHLSFKQLTLSDGIPIFLLKLEPEPVPSLRLRLRNTVFLQYEYIKCTQYTYPLLLSDGCRKGSGRHLPRHTDCLTEPVIQLTAFIIKSIVSTSAVFTHALCATLTQCELFPLCIYINLWGSRVCIDDQTYCLHISCF